jgi:hydrogenase/urease accessory protein HupE
MPALSTALGVLLLLLVAPQPAWAHGVSLGQSKIRQQGEDVRYELAVSYDELAKRVGVPPQPSDASSSLRAAALREHRGALTAHLDGQVRVLRDGDGCPARLDTVEVERFEGKSYAILSSTYRCPGGADGFEVHYDLLLDELSELERSSHANIADYDLGGETGRFVFESGQQRLRAGQGTKFLAVSGHFVGLGVEHILSGLDHVLFVLALLIGAGNVRTVLKVATAFTVAHSLTLVAAATEWVVVPPSVVEPAIALSIVAVALQNILQREPKHRLVLVFGFGLLHGLGFAAGLSFGEEISWRLITSLLAFNVGIEVGQAAVILIAAPLLLLLRRRSWSRPAQWTASGVIALCGVVWSVGRLTGG